MADEMDCSAAGGHWRRRGCIVLYFHMLSGGLSAEQRSFDRCTEDAIYLVPEDMDDQYQYPQEAVEGFVEDYLEETDRVGEFICYETAAASEE